MKALGNFPRGLLLKQKPTSSSLMSTKSHKWKSQGTLWWLLFLLLAFYTVKQSKLELNVKAHRKHLWCFLRLQEKIGFTPKFSHEFSNENFTSNIWTSKKSSFTNQFSAQALFIFVHLCPEQCLKFKKAVTKLEENTCLAALTLFYLKMSIKDVILKVYPVVVLCERTKYLNRSLIGLY